MAKYYREKDVENLILNLAAESGKLETVEVSEDCISREELSEGILMILNYWHVNTRCFDEVKDFIKNAPSVIPTQNNAIQHVESVEKPKEGEWIPCSERLPTTEGHYLCSLKKPHRIDNIYVGLAYWTGGRWYGYLANEITAWMPLPKPYTANTPQTESEEEILRNQCRAFIDMVEITKGAEE